jgi:hypothetical protein
MGRTTLLCRWRWMCGVPQTSTVAGPRPKRADDTPADRILKPLPATAGPLFSPQNSATSGQNRSGPIGAFGTRLAPEGLSRLSQARQGGVDGVGRLRVAFAEQVGIDLRRGVRRGVTEPLADRDDIDAGVDQLASVCLSAWKLISEMPIACGIAPSVAPKPLPDFLSLPLGRNVGDRRCSADCRRTTRSTRGRPRGASRTAPLATLQISQSRPRKYRAVRSGCVNPDFKAPARATKFVIEI